MQDRRAVLEALGVAAIAGRCKAYRSIIEERHMKNAIVLTCVLLMGSIARAQGDRVHVIGARVDCQRKPTARF